MNMKTKHTEVSEAAAFLAGDPEVKERVEQEIGRNKLVSTLIRIRIDKNVTQKQIADVMQCDPSKISKLEAGNDMNLKWIDVIGYLTALGVNCNIHLEDKNLSAADKIKHHVFMIHELLEQLAALAKEVCDDTEIAQKIHQFYGEVLLNFLARFNDSYEKLSTCLQFPPEAAVGQSQKVTEGVGEKHGCLAGKSD